MDRDEAGRALELLRSVVARAKDDTALQNWGAIWILHGVSNGVAFSATNWLLLHTSAGRWSYAALWLAVVALNLGSIAVLKRGRAGARTFIENQIWSIWLTFIGAVVLLAVVNDLLGMPLFGLGPVIGILSAVGFASMGAVMGRRWYLGTLIFALSSLAMARWPRHQFYLLGVVWGVAQIAGGIWLTIEKRRRAASAARVV